MTLATDNAAKLREYEALLTASEERYELRRCEVEHLREIVFRLRSLLGVIS